MLLLITQLIALATSAAEQIVTLKSQLGAAASSTEAQNLADSEQNLNLVVQHAQAALGIKS
jgi:hypothetical protein